MKAQQEIVMNKHTFVILSVLLLVLLTSCTSGLADDESSADKYQTVKSYNSNITMEFPKDWDDDGHQLAYASIEMYSYSRNQAVIVVEENMEDFVDDITIDDYAWFVLQSVQDVFGTTQIPAIEDIQIGDGIYGKQFEISGEIEYRKLTYLATCAEAKGIMVQFRIVSLQSEYDEMKPIFDNILNSFHI